MPIVITARIVVDPLGLEDDEVREIITHGLGEEAKYEGLTVMIDEVDVISMVRHTVEGRDGK